MLLISAQAAQTWHLKEHGERVNLNSCLSTLRELCYFLPATCILSEKNRRAITQFMGFFSPEHLPLKILIKDRILVGAVCLEINLSQLILFRPCKDNAYIGDSSLLSG